MSSKVRLRFKSKTDKVAEVFPKTPELKEALLKKERRDYVLIKSNEFISFEVMKTMLNIEIIDTERIDDEKLKVVKEEIIAVSEAHLLLKLFRSLRNSKEPEHIDLYEQIRVRLDALKLMDLLGD